MIRRILWLAIAAAAFAILFYVSRFWSFRLWGREGLFGAEWLRPQGNLIPGWLRGSDFTQFDLILWAVGAFALLTLLQWLYDLTTPKD